MYMYWHKHHLENFSSLISREISHNHNLNVRMAQSEGRCTTGIVAICILKNADLAPPWPPRPDGQTGRRFTAPRGLADLHEDAKQSPRNSSPSDRPLKSPAGEPRSLTAVNAGQCGVGTLCTYSPCRRDSRRRCGRVLGRSTAVEESSKIQGVSRGSARSVVVAAFASDQTPPDRLTDG